MARMDIEYSELDNLQQVVEKFGDSANKDINEILHSDEAAEIVENNIQPLLPSSGRRWKGKKTAAAAVQPFRKGTEELLTLIVRSKTAYNYLYFPDDGSNTDRHQGNQHFMQRGGDNSTSRIIELCTAKITENFNNGG